MRECVSACVRACALFCLNFVCVCDICERTGGREGREGGGERVNMYAA